MHYASKKDVLERMSRKPGDPLRITGFEQYSADGTYRQITQDGKENKPQFVDSAPVCRLLDGAPLPDGLPPVFAKQTLVIVDFDKPSVLSKVKAFSLPGQDDCVVMDDPANAPVILMGSLSDINLEASVRLLSRPFAAAALPDINVGYCLISKQDFLSRFARTNHPSTYLIQAGIKTAGLTRIAVARAAPFPGQGSLCGMERTLSAASAIRDFYNLYTGGRGAELVPLSLSLSRQSALIDMWPKSDYKTSHQRDLSWRREYLCFHVGYEATAACILSGKGYVPALIAETALSISPDYLDEDRYIFHAMAGLLSQPKYRKPYRKEFDLLDEDYRNMVLRQWAEYAVTFARTHKMGDPAANFPHYLDRVAHSNPVLRAALADFLEQEDPGYNAEQQEWRDKLALKALKETLTEVLIAMEKSSEQSAANQNRVKPNGP